METTQPNSRTAIPTRLSAPKISVVIPTYNRARFLKEALESVFSQTVADREIIVVDDGSSDETRAVLEPFRDRIRYLYQENAGGAAARNRGIAAARGEWVAFLDSDDRWEPHALQALLEAASRHPEAGFIIMRACEIDAAGQRTGRRLGKRSPGPFFTTPDLLWGDSGSIHMPMIRRSLLETVGGFDESLAAAQDCELAIRFSFHTRLVSVPEPLLLRRVHSGNLSSDMLLNSIMWLRVLEKLKREQSGWVRRHAWVYRRAVGKEHLRAGRELLVRSEHDARAVKQATDHLRRSLASYPLFIRAWIYLAWSALAPSSYPMWRRMERRGLRLRRKDRSSPTR